MPERSLLPARDFPALPGEQFDVGYETKAGRRRIVRRVPKVDLALPAAEFVRKTCHTPQEETYKTVRKEFALLFRKYGERRVRLYPDREAIVAIVSRPVTLVGEGLTVRLGPFEIKVIRANGYPHLRVTPLAPKLTREGYFHPHISMHGDPCFGDGIDRIFNALDEGFFSDVVALMLNHLETYNHRGAFRHLSEWVGHPRCPRCHSRFRQDIWHRAMRLCSECGDTGCRHCIPLGLCTSCKVGVEQEDASRQTQGILVAIRDLYAG